MTQRKLEPVPFAESAGEYPGTLHIFTGSMALQQAAKLVQFRAEGPQVYHGAFAAIPPQADPRRYDWRFCRNRDVAIRQAGKAVDDETVLTLAAFIMQAGANIVVSYVANRLVQACKAIGGVQWLY
jgi:hypothetical protein